MQPEELNNLKNNLINAVANENADHLADALLDIRVRAMQTQPSMRKDLIRQLVMGDILGIQGQTKFELVLKILQNEKGPVRHAISALLSVIASTLEGISYLTLNNQFDLVEHVIKVDDTRFPQL
jgi:hypothetical protein